MKYSFETNDKNVMHGIAAAPGITIAKAFLYSKEVETVDKSPITDIDEAKQNLSFAIEKSKKELNKIFNLAIDKLGEQRAAIFEAQIMILEDMYLIEKLYQRIDEEKLNPEFIVHDEITKYQNMLNSSVEDYLKERANDIGDIKNRIIKNLKNKQWKSRIQNDVIVVAEMITPADTVLFTRVNVKGYITNFGGLTSHAAILARSLNIPAVLGIHDSTARIKDDDRIIIDGFHGTVIINPTEEQLNYYENKIRKLEEFDKELLLLKNKKAITIDGHEISIHANLDIDEELVFVQQNGANGIGLLRTEQFFNVLDNIPDEEFQLGFYKKISESVYPNKLTIRTFDIGGDKFLPYDVKEPNPMLGWRGIRFLLDHPQLLKSQMKAILRASVNGNIQFMIPMVSSIDEVKTTIKYLEECKSELRSKNIAFDEKIKFGIMIEVPSASLLIKEFSKYVDFFSIGTNDLIQYLLACDRGNEIVNQLYQEFHPAILRALNFMVNEARNANKPISICGEMASDKFAVPFLIGIGFNSLSMNASSIPFIKKIIRNISFKACKTLADECLSLSSEKEIFQAIETFFKNNIEQDIEKIFT
jgi:phosphotransferase system enzyme I (PtsI)